MASLVPTVGKAILSGRMIGATPAQTEPHFIGWGTGAGAGAAASTDLSTPAPEARANGTSTQATVTVTNDTHQVVGTITATAGRTITNVGIFDAAGSGSPPSGGVLYAIFDGLSQALNSGDSIQFTARVTFS
ncbi:MAG TPA: hypothetical protein VFB50_00770 [Chloroflexota bacterium]|nr:hypothetical protein [Chloroflexota bacterium]